MEAIKEMNKNERKASGKEKKKDNQRWIMRNGGKGRERDYREEIESLAVSIR